MKPTWQPPRDYRNRPVAILGAGVLGRRVGCIWASAGYSVRLRDPSEQQRADAITYIEENVQSYSVKTGKTPGSFEAFKDMEEAVADAWLVIEAVPEKIELKTSTFAELETTAPEDCILASNSSSYKSSEMISKVSDQTKSRILNMHYYMPPQCMIVELMTDGYTASEIFPFMVERSQEAATLPYVARKESTGFIFNRLWAAVKREVLTIIADGVSVPEEIDDMWLEMFIKGETLPCRMMDKIGLDTVAFIENHYVHERGLSSEKTVDFLRTNYLDQGKLGNKCSQGGLYAPDDKSSTPMNGPREPEILVLDVGLSASTPSTTSGQILKLTADGNHYEAILKEQALPDGLAVDQACGRMFWTCMGVPGKPDGAVYSAKLDGSDIITLVAPGIVNTPKQLSLDHSAQKIYFCDREGCRVYRCSFDGSDLETLVDNIGHDLTSQESVSDWCVGVTVSPALGKFFWTQKGPPKGGKGRIFCANIMTPVRQSMGSRNDVQCVLSGLPEPIDLEIDEDTRTLYWTDRGEIPWGNSLNKTTLDEAGLVVPPVDTPRTYETITRGLNEAIGLKLDVPNSHIYLTDLGGSVYRCNLDGTHKQKIFSEDLRAFTGIALLRS
ncbi:unnamed protein product [Penicillium salamii]|uniref:Uncharacterized protein n=1 Tax=Penicillium salamii TaxID=1612424 RepID=A0A9W4NUM6_9EURO|nr:unnamed protein product [Penicillium salamii]CAG8014453.1 unnamed protein product [Penicillium salamii]CAG8016278.1 unnamed protein product [Penicillium salamii]CAG8058605.1 unnamed protein product [Penicillium salamii]CAG8184415.1 unnamed protein product [Penicillium salamii]